MLEIMANGRPLVPEPVIESQAAQVRAQQLKAVETLAAETIKAETVAAEPKAEPIPFREPNPVGLVLTPLQESATNYAKMRKMLDSLCKERSELIRKIEVTESLMQGYAQELLMQVPYEQFIRTDSTDIVRVDPKSNVKVTLLELQ